MRVVLGADHAGAELKNELKHELDRLGIVYEDVGTDGPSSVDYPDFAVAVARGVSDTRFDRGVLVCGSGIGMAIAANKDRAEAILRIFLETPFAGGRHAGRVEKIHAAEKA